MSQCYASSTGGGGGLKYITNSSSSDYSSAGNIAYSASASTNSYGGSVEISLSPSSSMDYGGSVQYKQDELTYSITNVKPEYNFVPDNFLKPGKEGKFVGKADEIKSYVEDAFTKIFNDSFPEDIKISVLDQAAFRKLAPNPSTTGLSINRRKQGLLSEIFVLNDNLGRVMLTLGHELGHVLTETLDSAHDEEAKAYAFSLEWMKVIKQNNIGDLGSAIVTERPADNGLHNVAFFFVEKMVQEGKRVWQIYLELVRRLISVPIAV